MPIPVLLVLVHQLLVILVVMELTEELILMRKDMDITIIQKVGLELAIVSLDTMNLAKNVYLVDILVNCVMMLIPVSMQHILSIMIMIIFGKIKVKILISVIIKPPNCTWLVIIITIIDIIVPLVYILVLHAIMVQVPDPVLHVDMDLKIEILLLELIIITMIGILLIIDNVLVNLVIMKMDKNVKNVYYLVQPVLL